MIKRIFISFIFVISNATQSQTPLPSSGSITQDITALLGAINGAKVYAERCFTTGGPTSRQGIDDIMMRLRSYEKIEIEMHYYLVREIMKIEKKSSSESAENIQQYLLRANQEFSASIDLKALHITCSNFSNNIINKTGDFNYIYAAPLQAIRATR